MVTFKTFDAFSELSDGVPEPIGDHGESEKQMPPAPKASKVVRLTRELSVTFRGEDDTTVPYRRPR